MVMRWVSLKEAMPYYGWSTPYHLWQAFLELNPASLRLLLPH
jgi:hypothetical protein